MNGFEKDLEEFVNSGSGFTVQGSRLEKRVWWR